MGTENQPKLLPVFKFSMETLKQGTSYWVSLRNDVVQALEEYGCFVAEYDPVSLQLHNTIFASSKELLDLPLETKIKNTYSRRYHGYQGQISWIPLYEGLGIEDATNKEKTQSFMNLMWAAGNHQFCESSHLYSELVAELDKMATRMVFESYGLDKYYESHVASTTYLIRFLKYRVPLMNENVIGQKPHSDKNFSSIIHQNQVPGLEIETKEGEWISFQPSPSSFLYMAADAFVVWSNGRLRGCKHRVMMREKQERYSIGMFTYHDGKITTPKELVDDGEHPLKFKPYDYSEYLRFFATEEGQKAEKAGRLLEGYCGV